MTLEEMSQEYLHNVAVLMQQVETLNAQLSHVCSPTERHKLRRRIAILKQMISEGQATAHYLAHYYERREPVEYAPKRRRGRPRGTGTRTDRRRRYPKGIIPSYGTRTHTPRVSSLCAVLSGRYDAK